MVNEAILIAGSKYCPFTCFGCARNTKKRNGGFRPRSFVSLSLSHKHIASFPDVRRFRYLSLSDRCFIRPERPRSVSYPSTTARCSLISYLARCNCFTLLRTASRSARFLVCIPLNLLRVPSIHALLRHFRYASPLMFYSLHYELEDMALHFWKSLPVLLAYADLLFRALVI